MIRVIYTKEPNWGPEDNHPNAKRLEFDHPTRGKLFVDYLDATPSLDDINAILEPKNAEQIPSAGAANGGSGA